MSILETLTLDQQALIQKHLDLVLHYNEVQNLTRITDKEEGMLLHIEDSLEGLPFLNQAPEGNYVDIGTGAGYPGIPLAIASGRMTTLIDSRKKKVDILNQIVSELGLSENISLFAGRAELYTRKHPESFSVVTARALSQLPTLLELASPLLNMKGQLICYKGQLSKEELICAKQIEKLTGMKLTEDKEFLLNNEYHRHILVFTKVKKPTINLPRQEGMAQKHPLKA